MRIASELGYRLSAVTAVAVLAGCNGSGASTSMPSIAQTGAEMQAPVRAKAGDTAVPACVGRGFGTATCDALIRTDVVPGLRPDVSGYGPADLQAAYNLPSSTDGAGQIVAIVDAYDNPNVASDVAAYRAEFGLPPANLVKYNQNGQTGNYPAPNTGWGVEIDLDSEMVSASCPLCTIYLVEADSSGASDLQTAEAEAVTLGAHVVSNGFTGTGLKRSSFDTSGVTYLGSAGDGGQGVGEPAAFGTVVAVGGTSLSRGGGGKRGWTESVWKASGGGCTTEPKPRWQHDTACAFRLANDVSAVGDPNTGVAEYDTYGYGGWFVVGGTGVATPFLAGVFGLAGNAGMQDGGRTFWQKEHQQYLYRLKSGGKYVRYSTTGGWGSPNGVRAF